MPMYSRVDISSAYARIRHLIRETPCKISPCLSEMISKSFSRPKELRIILKCENLQLSGSFKYRGALNKLLQLNRHQLERGLVTYSTGNHALALLMAAGQVSKLRNLTIPLEVYVPSSITKDKISALQATGNSVIPLVKLEDDIQRCADKALESYSRNGATFVPPANDTDIILGQATAAAEFYDQVTDYGYGELDAIVAPCGGGSLLAGCASWFEGSPTQVWGAEPLIDGPGLHDSLEAGVLLPKAKKSDTTIADGQRTTISPKTWSLLSAQTALRGSIAVRETQIREALSWYYTAFGGTIEPSSAVAIAACAAVVQQQNPKNNDTSVTTLGVILSGGNISATRFHNLRKGLSGD